MTPAQLRQHAAVRFTTVNKQDWCDAAVQALRDAADEIDRLRTEAVAADIRIANDALAIAGLTAERDALARCKLADQDAYVAMRDQRDAARADAKRLDFMITSRAYVVSDESCCDGYWLHYAKPDGTTWVQASEHETPRAAIDAAMKGEQP